jgi:DivIVA domain-containing protein
MAAGQPDRSVPGTTDRIREAKFDTVKRGYDPAQVLQHLGRVADRVQVLEDRIRRQAAELAETRRLLEEASVDRPSADPYDGVSARVVELLRTFDEDVARLRRDAEEEAMRVVAQAEIEAERIGKGLESLRHEARAEADRIISDARIEAERIRVEAESGAEDLRTSAVRAREEARAEVARALSDLGSRRAALQAELQGARDRVLEWLGRLGEVLEPEPEETEVVVVEDVDGPPAASKASQEDSLP